MRFISFFVLVASTFLYPVNVNSQKEKSFVSFEFLDVSKEDEEKFLNLNAELKPLFAGMEENPLFTNRALLKLVYPIDDDLKHNYIVITSYSNYAALHEASIEKILSSINNDLTASYAKLYNLVSREFTEGIWRDFLIAKTGTSTNLVDYLHPGNYVFQQFLNVKEDKWDEYVNLERDIWLPIHERNLTKGGLKFWTLIGYQFENRKIDYDLISFFVYPKFEFVEYNIYTHSLWNEVHGKERNSEIFTTTFELRDEVHARLYEVVDVLKTKSENN